MVERETLEERSHFRGVRQAPMRGDVTVERGGAEGAGQRLRALGDAEAFEVNALRGEAAVAGACVGGGVGERFKIHMGGQVGCAGGVQDVDGFVIAHCLHGVAQGAPVAIVDDKRGPAVGDDPLRNGVRLGGGGGVRVSVSGAVALLHLVPLST